MSKSFEKLLRPPDVLTTDAAAENFIRSRDDGMECRLDIKFHGPPST